MTITEPTETTVLIPEVRIPSDFRATVESARELAREMAPKVAELARLVREVRDVNDDALRAIGHSGLPLDADGVLDSVGVAVGWVSEFDKDDPVGDGVWNLVADLIDDLTLGDFGGQLNTTGLTNTEIHRGGEPDIAMGERVRIALPEEEGGEVVEMTVFGPPDRNDVYTLIRPHDDNGKQYGAPHDEVKAGLST